MRFVFTLEEVYIVSNVYFLHKKQQYKSGIKTN